MAKILIPTPLRQYADQQNSVELPGSTVGEALLSLTTRYSDLRKHLYNDEGKLRSFVNVYVNDEDIRYMSKDATPLKDGDTVSIVPSIAGGSTTIAPSPAAGAGAPVEAPPVSDPNSLTKEEILRYSRHLIMPEVGMDGQLKLKNAKVALIGTGGLGAPLGLYLAAAGVGRIGLVDFDVVDFTNLQRQVIHGTRDVGRKKLDSAAETMLDINPHIHIDRHEVALTSENAMEILKDYDIVVDGTDNFPTRYLVNDACVLLGKPNVYGSIFRFEGQATVFAYQGGPCYRCLYPEPPPPGLVPSCAEGGVLGILPGTIGLIQATETVKLILGIGELLVGRLLLYDALTMRFRELKLRKNPDCPVCGDHPTIRKLIDYQEFCGIPQQPDAATQQAGASDDIEPAEVKAKMDRHDSFVLIDVREPHEYKICTIPGARLIPLGELPKRVHELSSAGEIIAHCKSGARSAKAVEFLKQAGFRKVRNMKGGILAWSDKVDPSVPKY
ncbi:MAG: molybdopterin-synthase adenylyltransferase MoeB [Acidobacteriota bacterium]|nr:molybdopterin-synthase adenylyltransferase MoeB [Acidobacteriota bacterium]